ncbi:MAG: polysaccharide pyruvyl transferase family protein [Candidatus Bathyarchaeota archaeon]|nr:MAG: polysaccharide pyruvyl transferase family protein [Candidatus Bathyarchaeota archaeon]
MKYGIVGWYGRKNLGDELLLKCLTDFFGRKQAIVFTTSASSAEVVKKNHNLKAFEMTSLSEHDIDFLIFGGGDVFHDLTAEWYFPESLMDKIECPILMLSVGIPFGEGHSTISRSIDRFVDSVCFVSFRDAYSRKIFSDLWSEKASYILPDLGFLIEKQQAQRKNGVVLQVRAIPKSYRPITPKNFQRIAFNQFTYLNSEFKKRNLSPKFLLFNPKDSRMLPNDCISIDCFSDSKYSRAIAEICSSEALIGTSLHSSMIALTQGTPFRAYRYQGKIDGVIGMICKERVVYPSKVFPFKDLYPIDEFTYEEKKHVNLIKQYLKESLDIIKRHAINRDFQGIVLPEFPIEESVSESYGYAKLGHKPKILRDLRNWIYSQIGK